MTVIFADLLIRLELTVWAQELEFFQTPAAADYDRFMGDLGQVYGSRTEDRGSKIEDGGADTDDRFRPGPPSDIRRL